MPPWSMFGSESRSERFYSFEQPITISAARRSGQTRVRHLGPCPVPRWRSVNRSDGSSLGWLLPDQLQTKLNGARTARAEHRVRTGHVGRFRPEAEASAGRRIGEGVVAARSTIGIRNIRMVK